MSVDDRNKYKYFRICAINGSSRTDGQTAKRLSAVLQDIKRLGAKTKMIHLVKANLKPCDGKEVPKLRNDFRKILNILEASDGIIFGTPTYWFNMSGLMKNFIDRLTVTERRWSLHGKVAGFLATGSREEDGAMAALLSIAAVVNHLGMTTFPYSMLYFRGSGSSWAKKDIHEYGQWMLKMIDITEGLRSDQRRRR